MCFSMLNVKFPEFVLKNVSHITEWEYCWNLLFPPVLSHHFANGRHDIFVEQQAKYKLLTA